MCIRDRNKAFCNESTVRSIIRRAVIKDKPGAVVAMRLPHNLKPFLRIIAVTFRLLSVAARLAVLPCLKSIGVSCPVIPFIGILEGLKK